MVEGVLAARSSEKVSFAKVLSWRTGYRFDPKRCSARAGFSGMILHRLETFCGELIQVAVPHHIPCDNELFDFAVPVVGERDGLADVS